MANRVLLGLRGSDYGLWVSKPAQNVLTAPPSGLLFSSDYAALTPAVTGSFTVGWGAKDAIQNQAVMLGVTFPTPPQMLFKRLISSGRYRVVGDNNGFYFYYLENISGGSRKCWILVSTSTDRINVQTSWSSSVGSVAPPTIPVSYTAFNYNL